jgi:hypothetical protein
MHAAPVVKCHGPVERLEERDERRPRIAVRLRHVEPVAGAGEALEEDLERDDVVVVGLHSPPGLADGWYLIGTPLAPETPKRPMNTGVSKVGDTGLEPVTSALSRRRSPS